ncbi:MAG: acid phosphatase [Micromonosporaceae bacterium]|nr:acid phosphatase [Micromonosporaceae bacterium]
MGRIARRTALVMITLSTLVASPVSAAQASEPAAPASEATPLAAGYSSGLPPYRVWLSEVASAVEEANNYLETRMSTVDQQAAAERERVALVLDIDNTALASSYDPGKPVEPVLEMATAAHRTGAAVFFVTARPEWYRSASEDALIEAGYPLDGIYLGSSHSYSSVEKQKTASRIAIERLGYTIIANVGNNWHDLAGEHAERTYKLPDYNGLLG